MSSGEVRGDVELPDSPRSVGRGGQPSDAVANVGGGSIDRERGRSNSRDDATASGLGAPGEDSSSARPLHDDDGEAAGFQRGRRQVSIKAHRGDGDGAASLGQHMLHSAPQALAMPMRAAHAHGEDGSHDGGVAATSAGPLSMPPTKETATRSVMHAGAAHWHAQGQQRMRAEDEARTQSAAHAQQDEALAQADTEADAAGQDGEESKGKAAQLFGKAGRKAAAPDLGNVAALLGGFGTPGSGAGDRPETAAVGGLITDLSRIQTCIKITSHGDTQNRKYTAADLQKLAVGAHLYDHTSAIQETTVRQIVRPIPFEGVWFLPSDMMSLEASGNAKLYSGKIGQPGYFTRVLVLFPSQMRAPAWLRDGFVPIDERLCVRCNWGHRSRLEKLVMWATDRDNEAGLQTLSVWYSKKVYGANEEFVLFGPNSKGDVTDKPYVPAFLISKDASKLRRVCQQWAKDVAAGVSDDQFVPHERADSFEMMEWVVNLGGSNSSGMGGSGGPEAERQSTEDKIKNIIDSGNEDLVKTMLFAGHFSETFKDPMIQSDVERLAIERGDPALMLMLIKATRRELTFKALEFLVHTWSLHEQREKGAIASEDLGARPRTGGAVADAAAAFDGVSHDAIEEFLVHYVRERRHPLSTTLAILEAITEEIRANKDAARAMLPELRKFQSLSRALLDELLDDNVDLPTLHRLLYPLNRANGVSRTINDASPMMVAFESQDLEFMSHDLLYTYVSSVWVGRQLLALTGIQDQRSVSVRNPLLLYRVLKAAGFGGGPASGLLKMTSQLWHLTVFCSCAFFNSPRGRWLMHAICEAAFLVLYQVLVVNPTAPGSLILNIIFFAFTVGNMAEILHFVMHKFGRLRHVGRYAKDPWCALNLFTNSLLLVLSATTLALYAADQEVQAERRDRWINMAFCSAGVLVWARLLQLVVPVYHSLGPLLTTAAAMVGEVAAFVFPYIVVVSGFATLMTGVYADTVAGYSSWIEAMLTLFAAMLGDFSFNNFEVDKTTGEPLPGHMVIFGQVVLVLYLVMVAILLLNLLLAIMLNRYKPEEAEGQSQFKQAQVVDYYQQQVEQTYMCGPLNLLHYLLFWLPEPTRSLQRSHRTEVLMLVNPDGEVLPEMINNPEFDLLAGRGEFPHFVFLLTVYPLLSLAAVGGYILCLPFAVLQFSANAWESFFKQWVKRMDCGQVHPTRTKLASVAGKAAKPVKKTKKAHGGAGKLGRQLDQPENLSWQRTTGALLLRVPVMCIAALVGLVLYIFVFGFGFMFIWFTVVVWLCKVCFSLHNMLVFPWLAMWSGWHKAREREGRTALLAGAGSLVAQGKHAGEVSGCLSPVKSSGPSIFSKSAKWGLLKEAVQEMNPSRLLDTKSIDRALAVSEFAPQMAGWPWCNTAPHSPTRAPAQQGPTMAADGASSAALDQVVRKLDSLATTQDGTAQQLVAMQSAVQAQISGLEDLKEGLKGLLDARTSTTRK